MKSIIVWTTSLLIACIGSGVFAAGKPFPLRILHDIRLPGRTTRFDYQSFDPKSGLLFISHLGDNQILAFNTRTQRLAAIIRNVPEVHGVLAVPQLDRAYASATGVNEVFVMSEKPFRIIARTSVGNHPDGLAYDPQDRLLFVSDEFGDADTVINTNTNRPIATIHLGGQAGNTQYDPISGLMYVDVQTADRLVAMNPRTKKVVASYLLPGCVHDHGLYIDAPHRLAFVACDRNMKLLAFSLRKMRVTGIHSVGNDPDVLALDPALGRLYIGSESGVVSVFKVHGDGLVKLGERYLAYEAHSVAVDSKHRVYFDLQNIGGHPVLRVMTPTDRKPIH